MKTIWKYTLYQPVQDTSMPQGARILSATEQHGEIVVYAWVDTDQPNVWRRVQYVGTGESEGLGDEATFVGTVKLQDGALMFHVFAYPERT